MKRTIAHILAAALLGVAAGVALTQPSDSNWREQGGLIWHIGGDLDVESGGEIDIEAGGALVADAESTVTLNTTSTIAGPLKVSGTKGGVTLTLNAGSTTKSATGLELGDGSYAVYHEPTANVTIVSIDNKTATGFDVKYQADGVSPDVRFTIVHY